MTLFEEQTCSGTERTKQFQGECLSGTIALPWTLTHTDIHTQEHTHVYIYEKYAVERKCTLNISGGRVDSLSWSLGHREPDPPHYTTDGVLVQSKKRSL